MEIKKTEKKAKVKKVREKKPFKERLGGLFFTVIALGIAVAVFVGFMFLQNYFSERINYKDILVVKSEIPAGEIITTENIQNYFTRKQINVLDALRALSPSFEYETSLRNEKQGNFSILGRNFGV